MTNEEGVPGEEASSPGLLANLLARGPMMQVGQQCPAVKRECPASATAQVEAAKPFVLDRLPDNPPATGRGGGGTRLRRVLLRWQAPQPCRRRGDGACLARLQGGSPHGIPYVNPYVIVYAQGWRTPGLGT